MSPHGRGDIPSVQMIVFGVLTLTVVAVFVVALSTSSAAFSVYNHGWDGTSSIRGVADETRSHVGADAAEYQAVAADATVAFVLSPDSRYDPTDVARVSEFVQSGGTLVVADDFGPHANALLRDLDASARLDGRPLRDPRSNYRSAAMPVATGVANRSLVAGVESVTFNHGTAVEPNDASVLVNTSEYAYLDTDGDDRLGSNETLDTYPVATVESVGEGRVVVVSDPSAFINAMLERPGNRQFVRALSAQRETVLLDYSHATGLPPLVLAALAVRQSAPLQLGVGALVVGALAVWSRRPSLPSGVVSSDWGGRVRGRDPSSDAISPDAPVSSSELAAYLERQHPDWDRERVERVVAALDRRRKR